MTLWMYRLTHVLASSCLMIAAGWRCRALCAFMRDCTVVEHRFL